MKKIKLFLQLRKQFLFSLPLFFLINILFISNNTVAQTATVATNKSDYSPGQYVIVTGSHWLPGETVKLTFTETPLLHPEQDFFANADGAGNIYNNEYLIAEHDLGQFFTLGATGLTSGKIATTTFTDSKGAYSLHWYAADPGVNSGKFLPTYNKLQPFQLTCPTPSGLGGRASNPLPNAQLYNSLLERDGVTSLQPKDLALCQVVPFLLEINVNGSTAPENGVINFNPEFLTKTTSGDDFGFDPAYGIYCAFVDYGEPGTVDPGNNARVDLYSSKIVGAGTSNETIRGSIQVSGLNDGDNIIVEIWVVLKCSIPPNINATGNIQTSMADATTGPAGPDGGLGTGDNISLGNQVVPLSQLGTFFTADADVSVTKSASPICIGNDLTYTIVVTNNSTTTVANTIVANDVFGAGQTFVSASGAPIDPQSGQNVTFNVGALTQGQAKTLTVVTHPTAAGTVTNSVSTTAITSDPNTANNTSILVNPLTGGNVAVNPLPTCSITPTPANSNHWCATSGMSSYLWSGPGSFSATTECVDVVTPGTYSVTITNANGCVSTCTKDLASCLDAATATPTNPTCGQTTGSVQVSPFDNTVTYELKQIGVLKYTASNTGLISSVAPGTYDLVATKTGICYASGSVTVGNAPPNLTTPAGTPTDPTCGQTTGSVQVSPFDNTITYQLKQGVTLKYTADGTGLFSSVAPGTYDLVASKTGSCSASGSVTVGNAPPNLTTPAGTPTDPTCGQTTGSVQVSPFDNTITYQLKQSGVLKYTASNTGLFINLAPGTYDLVASKTGSCSASGSVTVGNAPPNLTTPASTPTDPTCGQTTGSVQVSPFDNTITYQLKQGVTLKYTADGTGLFSNVVPGTYDLIASKIGSCSATGSVTISAPPPCVPLYTYTQGYYSSTGSSCTPSGGIKVGALALIKYSLDNFDGVVDGKGTLFLGKKKINGGTGSFTLNYNSADPTKDDLTKFVSVMPGGGTAATLTADYTIPLPTGILKNGKINNVLLSQAITLALNVHIQGENLGGFKLRNEYLTTLAPSGTACPRTAPAACSNSTLSSVKLTTNAGLKNWIALGKNVNDLLQLASDALGGGNIATLTGFTGIGLTDINNVIDVINKSFDGGRFFLGYYAAPQTCSTLPNATPKLYTVLREAFVRQTEQVKFTEVTEVNAVTSLTVTAYPNPFTDKVKFSIVSPVSGKASLEVYNMMGQKIRSIYQGYLFAGKGQVIEYRISSAYQGNLIYTLRVGDKQVNGKLVQMK